MKKYSVTPHAIDRAVERLNIGEPFASNHLTQLMQSAYYVGETPHSSGNMYRVFDHYKTQTRIIVSHDDTIITCYKFPTELSAMPDAFTDDIIKFIKRKFDAKKREHSRKLREYEVELAELNLDAAQLSLNKAKAKSPKVREALAKKIDIINKEVSQIRDDVNKAVEDFTLLQVDVMKYIDAD